MAPKQSELTLACTESSHSGYMSMYDKHSTDGFLRIGNECPDFACQTTQGYWNSFHAWKGRHWTVLCSHPRAFHPVGTTELGSLNEKFDTLQSIGCKTVALSVDSVEDHNEWLKDVQAYHSSTTNKDKPVQKNVQFPIVSDGDRTISELYGMIDPFTLGKQTLTVRSVFVINPDNILMLRLDYPACVGRNMDEIVRSVMALQLSYEHAIQTPANWPRNKVVFTSDTDGSQQEHKGAVFLLPTVPEKEAKQRFATYHTSKVPSGKNYLRCVRPQDTGIIDLMSESITSSGSEEEGSGSSCSAEFSTAQQQQQRTSPSIKVDNKHKNKKTGLSKWFSKVLNNSQRLALSSSAGTSSANNVDSRRR